MSEKKEYSEECKKIVAEIMQNVGIKENELKTPEKMDLDVQKKEDLPPVAKEEHIFSQTDIEQIIEIKHDAKIAEQAAADAALQDDAAATQDGKKKRKKKKNRLVRALLTIVIIIGLLGAGGYFGLRYIFNNLNYVPMNPDSGQTDQQHKLTPVGEKGDPALALTDEEFDSLKKLLDQNEKDGNFVLADENVWNVLLIGVDTLMDNGVGRSDSMILITVSKYTNSIVMTSLMRDIYLKIPDNGYDRINAALPWGGVSLLVDTIQSNFGIHVDNYAMVDFEIFQEIINALGGVYLTPTAEEVKAVNEAMVNLNHPEYKLEYTNDLTLFNGLQTLYYARIRSIGMSDYDRTERQRKVLLSAKERVLNMDLTEILDLINTFLPKITTDVDSNKCFSLLFSAFNILKNYEINQLRMPIDDSAENATIDGMYVLMIDFEANVRAWQELVYGVEDTVAETATDENGMPAEDPAEEDATTISIGNYDDLYGYDYGYNDYDYGYDYNYNYDRPGYYY